MAITFLDEEEDIVAAAEPPKVEGGITFLEEKEPTIPAVEPTQGPATPATVEVPKITFLDEEPQAPSIGGLTVPPAPEAPKPKPIVETIGQLEGIKNAAMNAFDSSRQAMAVAGGVSPEEAEDISKLEYQKEARKLSPAYSEYLQAEGMDAVKAFAKNPFEITTNIVAEGLAGSLYSLGAGVAAGGVAAAATAATGVGAPLAPAAFLGGQIGGTFAGSLATEYGGKVLEELQNAGMDIKDPESIQKFFGDEKLLEDARSQALKRGVPVAIFDGVSVGIAGRLARLPVQALTKTPTRLAVTEGIAQAALGGGGEIAGAVAAGEEIQPKAVFAEVVGEAGPAAAEITVGRIAERMARTPEQKQFDQNVLATQVATRASQDIAPATADAVERQVQDTLAETAETPDERVARLQREAQEAAVEIELEEEGAGLPPQPEATPTTVPTDELLRANTREEINNLVAEGMAREDAITEVGRRRKEQKQSISESVNIGDEIAVTINAETGTVLRYKIVQDARGGKAVQMLNEQGASVGPELTLDPDAINSGHSDIAGGQIVNRGATRPVTPTPEAAVAPVEPVVPEGEAQPITATRTVADSIRDKDTFIYNGQRGAITVEDGVTIFRPFGTQETFEVPINPDQTIGEIEGIEWARKGQARIGAIEVKPETATIIESQPTITNDDVDQAEPDFEVPPALIEIEKSQTLNDLADIFDTGESKVAQEGKRARKVSETPEFYRQVTPQQIGLAQRLVDNALRIIDALPVSDQQKQDMAEPYLLLDQDITNYENNPEYQRYKASIRTEVRPAGEAGVLPETETEVAAGVRELEQRAKAEAERLEREAIARRVAAGRAVFIPTPEGAAPTAAKPATAEARFSQFVQPKERPDLAEFPDFKSFEMDVRGVPVRFDIDSTKSDENTLYLESFRVPREERRQGVGREAMTSLIKWANENNVTLKGEALTAPADRQYRTPQEMREQGYMTPRELFNFYQTLGWEADPEGPSKTMGIPMVYRPKPIAEIKRTQDQYGVTEEEATSIVENKPFKVVTNREGALPSGWFYETYGGQAYAIPQAIVEKRLAAQGELRRLSRLERAALSGLLTEQRLVNETDAKSYINDAKSQGFTDDDIAAATTEAQAKWNERFGDNGNARQVAGDVSPPVVNFAAEEAERATRSRVTGGNALPSSKLFGMTAREALQYLADQNLGASDMEREGRPLNLSQLMQRAASVLAKMPLRILDADFIMKARGGARAYRANEGFIRFPATVRGEEYFEDPSTLVHEVGHTLTADAIRKYVFDRARANARGTTYSRALDQALANPDTPEQIKRLVSLYKQTLDELGLTEQYLGAGGLADLDPTRSQKSAWNRKKPLINKFTGQKIGWSELYALANLDEFVAQAWSSRAFQDMLKNIKVKNQPSVFEKFVRIIRDLFGFDSDTMAAAVIDASYALAQLEAPATGGTVEERIAATTTARGGAPEAGGIVPLAPAEEYSPRTNEERKAFDKASTNKVMARNPQLAVAAVRMKSGEITAGQYADLVDAVDPIIPKGADPIPTDEKIKQYIAADKAPMVGAEIENGKEVEFRIDIPTYNRSTANGDPVYAITAHEPVAEDAKRVGAPISYMGVAKVVNPTFMTRAISGKGSAIEIAVGAGKFPLATVKGNYEATTNLPADINNPEVWTEVGYNPIRSSFFVDTRSGDAVVGGSEAIMVGSRVFVKNAQMEARPTGVTMGEVYAPLPEPTGAPTFTEESPEAKTLSNLKASMDKVDTASEAKGGKPTTQKVSEIAANWMDQGGDERALQDAITENTNLSPTNAAKVAKAIAKQYDMQQQIAEAALETEAGVTLEGLPEGMEIPKDVDPKNKRTVLQRVIDATTGVRVKPVILQVPEKTALKEQIRLKARETREAKKAQQETANAVVEAIKALELRGPMRAKQAQALAKRAAKVIWTSEKSMENFIAYAERVMANTNYDADLREAKAAQKRAKELSKRDSIAAPQRETLEAIGNIGINLLNDPREFADVVNHYLRSFKPVVSEAYVVVPDAEMKSYLSAAEDVVNDAKAEFEIEDNERLADKYGITIDELKKYMDAEEIMDALTRYAKREVIEGILNEKSAGVKEALKGVDTTTLRADQRKLIDAMKVIDVKSLDAAEKQAYVRIGNNIIFNNNQTNGAEFFVATAKGQQSARDLAKNTEAMTKNKAWSNIVPALGSRRAKKVLKAWAEDLQSVADTFRNAFGKEAMTVFYEAMGMVDLDLGFTNAARTLEEIQSKMEKFYKKLDKKYKGAATNQDGILSEGIVGYLIQNVPEKGEADSLAQRRGLLQQDIAERRKSGDEDRMQMADRIQELMQKLDGETVDQILANLKREYPANHESLTWLKDELFPQYKDFLKQFDENFNDQANNYNTPNYLPIVYSNISPSIDLLQGKKKYYDNLSSAPKQSSYTIKRSDYTQLPLGDDGRKPKEIGLNLRRNAYNSLSDQITRAYTNPARQRIYSFLKTPESEEALGGAANRDFFAERIERLMESRERRGSFNKNAFEKAVDVLANLGRDIGTRIALAGSYQLIRQPADQVTVAIGVTGRADLMAKHLDPRQIKAARPVIDLFSIGRRGDASSGYKYINQMEGAQSRLERYYTEGNWVKAKEAAKNFADKFMAPLKVSDFTVAAATWMTFYRAYLAKNGIRFTTWEDAANLIKSDDVGHKRAAAYAENMTDIYQGSSDPTKMAVFAQKGKTGPENLLKAILVPFNSFGVQFRSRISSELTEIFTRSGDWKGKAIAVKDLGATIGGTIMFGLAKRFVLPAITYGGVKILYSIFGVDVEEPDEEKQKEEFELKWRQLQGDIVSTMIVGGGGQMLESYTIDGMNYLKYMIDSANGSEDVLDDDGEVMSFNKYAKERAPFYRYRSFDNAFSLGILDIGMDQAKKSILNTKMVLTPEEMERFTPEEQRFLYVALISDWLYLGGFNDADFARMWDKGRRDMINARKEEEKALKKIREGR